MQLTPDILEIVRSFMAEQIPFNRFLGMQLEHLEEGRAVMSVPFRPELIGDPFRPALHGGVISALIDTCGGAAVWTRVQPTDRVSTIDLRVDYLLPGTAEALHADGRVIRVGNRVGVVSVQAYQPSAPDKIVAEGRAVYNIRRGPSSR